MTFATTSSTRSSESSGFDAGKGSSPARKLWIGAAWLAASVTASVLIWLPSLRAGFTGDDLEGVLRATRGARKLPGLDYAAAQFRPLSNLSLALDQTIWGLNSGGFHLTNAVLNGVVAALVGVLASKLWRSAHRQSARNQSARNQSATDNGDTALTNSAAGKVTDSATSESNDSAPSAVAGVLAGAAFLVMPSHTEAVAWVGGRGDLLVAIGTMCSLLAWWQVGNAQASGNRRSQWRWTMLSCISLGFALLAKETAATWPFVLSALEVTRGSRALSGSSDATASDDTGRAGAVRRALRPWPTYLTVVVWFLGRWAVIGSPFGSYGSSTLLADAPVGPIRHAVAVVVRSFVPGMPTGAWLFLGACIGAGAVTALVIRFRRNESDSPQRISWPLLFLPSALVLSALPVAGLGVSATSPLGERLSFVPSMFAAVLVAWVAATLISARPAIGWSATVVVLLTALTLCVVLQFKWVRAGELAAKFFESAGSLQPNAPALVLNQPDIRSGAYVARNALPASLALQHDWTDLTKVWSATTYEQASDGRVVITSGPGPSTWTIRLTGKGARFLETFPRKRSAGQAAVDVTLRSPTEAVVRVSPLPNRLQQESVWEVSNGTLSRVPTG